MLCGAQFENLWYIAPGTNSIRCSSVIRHVVGMVRILSLASPFKNKECDTCPVISLCLLRSSMTVYAGWVWDEDLHSLLNEMILRLLRGVCIWIKCMLKLVFWFQEKMAIALSFKPSWNLFKVCVPYPIKENRLSAPNGTLHRWNFVFTCVMLSSAGFVDSTSVVWQIFYTVNLVQYPQQWTAWQWADGSPHWCLLE